MSFYRKYRPLVIGEIDNAPVRQGLTALLSKEKKDLPHAYLLTGPKGAGKTTAARIIAKIFNCTHLTKHGPCGKCEQCKAIAEGRNLDVLEIDAASNRGIEEIRQLREGIGLAPAGGAYKIYIVDEVHMLTTEAFNALLKTLEEPPAHAVFVLATTDPQKIPVTVKSRCFLISFSRAGLPELMSALKRVVKAENLTITPELLTLIAEASDGSFRDAVKLLEQVSFYQGRLTSETVRQLLALGEENIAKDFLTSLAHRQAQKSLACVRELVKNGSDLKIFLVDCLGRLEQELVRLAQGEKSDLWRLPDLRELIGLFSTAYTELRNSPLPQLPLELAIVEFCEKQVTSDRREVVSEEKKDTPARISQSQTPSGLLTLEKLIDHWKDFIAEMKPYNHSVAGVLRSSRPKAVADGIVTLEAFYKFHQEKLLEGKTRETMARVLQKLFGEKVKVEIVLGKK